VLHDFFLSGILADQELRHYDQACWIRALYDSHGYAAVMDRFAEPDLTAVIGRYPANLHVLQSARGVIVHTEHARDLANQWYGPNTAQHWPVVPLVRTPAQTIDKPSAKQALGFKADDFVVCTFGLVSATKQYREILQAWRQCMLAKHSRAHLVFVGSQETTELNLEIESASENPQQPNTGQIHMTGWVSPHTYSQYLQAADLAIQLRTESRGETSAAVLDCLNHGLATIVNGHGSMAELDKQAVHMIAEDFSVAQLTNAIDTLTQDRAQRQTYASHARALIQTKHAPAACAHAMYQAIEGIYGNASSQLHDICRRIGELGLSDAALKPVASGLEKSFPPVPRPPRCLIDVTHLLGIEPVAELDAKTGKLLKAQYAYWCEVLPESWRLEFIHTDYVLDQFRYAQRLTSQSLKIASHWATDDVVQPWPGDVVVSHELCAPTLQANETFWPQWGNQVRQRWLVLAPVSLLESRDDATQDDATRVLRDYLLTVFNGLICNTETQRQAVSLALGLENTKSPRHQPTVCVGQAAFALCLTNNGHP